MDRINKYFLEAVGAFLKNQTVDWTEEMDCGTWNDLFRRAQEQSVLPLVFEAVYRNPKFAEIESEFAFVKREVQLQVIMQESRTTEFLNIYRFLNESHIFPIVVKGIICRQLYRLPDFRISSDEDLFVPRGQMGKCHKLLTQYGLETDCNLRSGEDLPEEITYVDGKKGICLEVHSALFGPKDGAYSGLNDLFADSYEKRIAERIGETEVFTMSETDHMLYLICHAFKHFLHSGFGIRQVCDIVQFANHYGSRIDWKYVREKTGEVHADVFAAALFRIGDTYFCLDREKAGMRECWADIRVDESELLEDLLESGVYGNISLARKHSSMITLNAVIAGKKQKQRSLTQSVFPERTYLIGRYPYLKKYPFLLPVAWLNRIWLYREEVKDKGVKESAAKSVEIGNRRVALLKKYKIL